MTVVRKLVIRLETWVRARPVALFQICAFLFARDFSSISVMFCFGAWASGNVFARLQPERFEMKVRRDIAVFLDQFSGCRFTAVGLKDAVGDEVASRVAIRSMGGQRPSLGRQLEERLQGQSLPAAAAARTHIYVVERESAGALPGALVAFPLRLGGYIFSTNHPAHCRGAARFYLLHELGHLSAVGNYIRYQSMVGSGSWWLVLLWSIVQCPLGWTPWIVVAPLYALLIVTFQVQFWNGTLRWQGDLVQEMSADHFGLSNLDRADAVSTARLHLKYALKQNLRRDADDSLPAEYEGTRQQHLRENLERILSDQPVVGVQPTGSTSPPVWIMLAATVYLAVYTRPLDTYAISSGAFLAVSTLLFCRFIIVRNRALDDRIRRVLGAKPRTSFFV